MPRLDGKAFYRTLEADAPELAKRVIFVTGDVAGTDAEEFLMESGCRWLAKPFRLGDLLRALCRRRVKDTEVDRGHRGNTKQSGKSASSVTLPVSLSVTVLYRAAATASRRLGILSAAFAGVGRFTL